MTATDTATETTTPAGTMTATVAADDLMRLITNASLAAGTDDTMPALTTVHFRPGHTPGTLMAEATNRYLASQEEIDLADLATYDSDWDRGDVIAHLADVHGVERSAGYDSRTEETLRKQHEAKHAEEGDHPDHTGHTVRPVPVTGLDVLVNIKDAVKLVKTLKLVIEDDTRYLTGRDRPHVEISFTEDDHNVAFKLVNNLGTDTTVSPRVVTGSFPQIDVLMANAALPAEELDAKLREPAGPGLAAPASVPDVWERSYSFNPDYLSRFAKVITGDKHTPVTFSFTASGRPALITIGSRYTALIMPYRKAV